MTLGERIRRRREALGLTVRQLSVKVGISHSSLTRIELGNTRSLSSDNLIAIAAALKLSLDALAHGDLHDYTPSSAESLLDAYPFPGFIVQGGVISQVNIQLLELTEWPVGELIGVPFHLARFRYPYRSVTETDLIVTHAGQIHVHHKIRPAKLRDDMHLYLVHLCTGEAIDKAVDKFVHIAMHAPHGFPGKLRLLATQVRRFGMRGVSIWVTHPVTGKGLAFLANEIVEDPYVPPWTMAQVRQVMDLRAPCEYLLPGLDDDGKPTPVGYPRRAISLPLGDQVITFGWSGELTLVGFGSMAQRFADSLLGLLGGGRNPLSAAVSLDYVGQHQDRYRPDPERPEENTADEEDHRDRHRTPANATLGFYRRINWNAC